MCAYDSRIKKIDASFFPLAMSKSVKYKPGGPTLISDEEEMQEEAEMVRPAGAESKEAGF